MPSFRPFAAGGALALGTTLVFAPAHAASNLLPLRAHADEVASYTLSARLEPDAHTVHGEGTIRWKNTSRVATSELWLHLYLNAFKNERSVFLREPLGRFRGNRPSAWGSIDVRRLALREGGKATELWPQAELARDGDDDETDARVPLPRAIASGEEVTLDVSFDALLPAIVERTGYSGHFHFVGQWFPKLARLEPDGHWAHFPFHHLSEFYADYGRYDVTLDVPAGYVVGATGPAIESRVEAGRRIERHVQDDVHDFAWVAWDEFRAVDERIDGVAVRLLFPPQHDYVAERELASLRFALPHFRERYGPYPYTVLTVVHPPAAASEAGGMEYPTLITTGGPWYGPPGVHAAELVTIHEFGHQYFYGLLASDEHAWPFLDEGLNSYAESQALSGYRGPGSLVSLGSFTVSSVTFHRASGLAVSQHGKIAQPASAFVAGRDYGQLIYSRTATLLETLRRVYGDARMKATMREYARRYRFRHPSPEDLLGALDEGLGAEASETARRALFERGWVDYRVRSVESRAATLPAGLFDRAGKRETVAAGQTAFGHVGSVLVTRAGTLEFPVEIELVLDDGSRRRVPWDGKGDTLRIPYHGSSPLVAAVIDPDRNVLLDEDLTNNHARAKGRAGAPRTFERALYAAELLLSAFTP